MVLLRHGWICWLIVVLGGLAITVACGGAATDGEQEQTPPATSTTDDTSPPEAQSPEQAPCAPDAMAPGATDAGAGRLGLALNADPDSRRHQEEGGIGVFSLSEGRVLFHWLSENVLEKTPQLSPNGRYFAWYAQLRGGAGDRLTESSGITLVDLQEETNRNFEMPYPEQSAARLLGVTDDGRPIVTYYESRAGKRSFARLGGDQPEILYEFSTQYNNTLGAALSADGSTLAFVENDGETWSVMVMAVDANKPTRIYTQAEDERVGYTEAPSISANGGSVAFLVHPQQPSRDQPRNTVVILDVASRTVTRHPNLTHPVVAPGGDRFAAMDRGEARGQTPFDIVIRAIDSTDNQQSFDVYEDPYAWSPDGRSLLVAGEPGTPSEGLDVLDLQSGETTLLMKCHYSVDSNTLQPVWVGP